MPDYKIFEKINAVVERLHHLASRRAGEPTSLSVASHQFIKAWVRQIFFSFHEKLSTRHGEWGKGEGAEEKVGENMKKKVDRLFVCYAQPHGVFFSFPIHFTLNIIYHYSLRVRAFRDHGDGTDRSANDKWKTGQMRVWRLSGKKIKPPEKNIKPGYFYAGY